MVILNLFLYIIWHIIMINRSNMQYQAKICVTFVSVIWTEDSGNEPNLNYLLKEPAGNYSHFCKDETLLKCSVQVCGYYSSTLILEFLNSRYPA